MPIYEYQCSLCGARLEAVQKMSDPVLTDCEECHRPGLHKLVSAAGFQLKGTGWYVTDFRDNNKKDQIESKTPVKTEETAASTEKPTEDKKTASTSGDKST